MKIKKIVIGALGLILLIFGLYAYELRALALEGNKIFEQRCLVVNPPLISYKNSFLSFADAMKNPGKYSNEEAVNFYKSYIEGMKVYAPKETEWLNSAGALLNRWDFKLIEPKYMKDAGLYQLKMYEAYRDEAQLSVDAIDGKITRQEYSAKFSDARTRRNDFSQLYFDIYNNPPAQANWRGFIEYVPMSEACTDEVLKIPDTTGALDPDPAQVKEPEITG